MVETMLKFPALPQQQPAKREVSDRREDFAEIYGISRPPRPPRKAADAASAACRSAPCIAR